MGWRLLSHNWTNFSVAIKSFLELNDVYLIHLVKTNSTKFYFLHIEIVWAFPTVMSLLNHKTFLNIKYLIVSSSLLNYQDLYRTVQYPGHQVGSNNKSHKEFCQLLFFLKVFLWSWAWWQMLLILAVLGQRQEDLCKFKASLVYIWHSRTARAPLRVLASRLKKIIKCSEEPSKLLVTTLVIWERWKVKHSG